MLSNDSSRIIAADDSEQMERMGPANRCTFADFKPVGVTSLSSNNGMFLAAKQLLHSILLFYHKARRQFSGNIHPSTHLHSTSDCVVLKGSELTVHSHLKCRSVFIA